MIGPDGLNIVLAWVFFGVLLVLLVWLLRRSRRDDALSSISRPADRPGAGDPHEPRVADRPNPDPPPGARPD